MKVILVPALILVAVCATAVTANKPNLVDLALSLNLTTFVEGIKKAGIDKIINHEGKFTVFAPTNEAFADEKCYPGEVSGADVLKFHVAWGEIKAKDILNERTMRTLLPKRKLRLNIYQKGQVVTANGRQIVSTDHEAHNGVIHVLKEVMSSVYAKEGSIVSEIDECCPHHSRLMELIKKAGLYQLLDRRGPYTFLPPTNGAFAKLHPDFINHLVKNETALRLVLLTHVIPGTIYSPALKNGDVVKTLSGAKLCVAVCNDVIMFGKAEVQMADITAGNGAIHSLDEVLFPYQQEECPTKCPVVQHRRYHAQKPDVLTALRHMGHTKFANALTTNPAVVNGLKDYTIFSPSDKAVPHFHSQEETDRFISAHITPNIVKKSSLRNDLVLNNLQNDKLRMNIYQDDFQKQILTVNGKEIKMTFHLTKEGGIIHSLKGDQNLMDVTGSQTLYQLIKSKFGGLASHPQFEIFSGLLSQHQYPLTVFAPAMNISASASLTELMMNHVVPTTLFEKGLKTRDQVYSLGGKQLTVGVTAGRLGAGKVNLNGVEIASLKETPTNGVLYSVDHLFL